MTIIGETQAAKLRTFFATSPFLNRKVLLQSESMDTSVNLAFVRHTQEKHWDSFQWCRLTSHKTDGRLLWSSGVSKPRTDFDTSRETAHYIERSIGWDLPCSLGDGQHEAEYCYGGLNHVWLQKTKLGLVKRLRFYRLSKIHVNTYLWYLGYFLHSFLSMYINRCKVFEVIKKTSFFVGNGDYHELACIRHVLFPCLVRAFTMRLQP